MAKSPHSPRGRVVGLVSGSDRQPHGAGQTSGERAARVLDGPGRGRFAPSRRYDLMWLRSDGSIGEASRRAPASPVFEDAVGAFCRGTLIATAEGPVAVEDLLPGMRVTVAEGGHAPLLWVGATSLEPDPNPADSLGGPKLLRVIADSFGPDRPLPDLVLGPRARLLYRDSRCRALIGVDAAFAPARAFADGQSVIAVAPVSPVRVHHLCFGGQKTIFANGLPVESYHPGAQAETTLPHDMREAFLALFPPFGSLDAFGPMPVPRLTAFELETLRAA